MSSIYTILSKDNKKDTTYSANQYIDQVIRVGSAKHSHILATITINKFEDSNNTQRFDFKINGKLFETVIYNKKTKEFHF